MTFITENPTLEQIQDTKTCYITKKDYNNFRQIQHDEQNAARLEYLNKE